MKSQKHWGSRFHGVYYDALCCDIHLQSQVLYVEEVTVFGKQMRKRYSNFLPQRHIDANNDINYLRHTSESGNDRVATIWFSDVDEIGVVNVYVMTTYTCVISTKSTN